MSTSFVRESASKVASVHSASITDPACKVARVHSASIKRSSNAGGLSKNTLWDIYCKFLTTI